MSDPPRPRVLISLDFELRWGMHDVLGCDFAEYRGNLERVPTLVGALLNLFEAHQIRATWAAVDAIGCDNWDDYFSRAPHPPKYKRSVVAIQPQYAISIRTGDSISRPIFFARFLRIPRTGAGHAHLFPSVFARGRNNG